MMYTVVLKLFTKNPLDDGGILEICYRAVVVHFSFIQCTPSPSVEEFIQFRKILPDPI